MVGAMKKLSNKCRLFHSVSEKFILDNCAKLKRIFHITIIFVTTFFVMQNCKI